jgi:hypothetical protein
MQTFFAMLVVAGLIASPVGSAVNSQDAGGESATKMAKARLDAAQQTYDGKWTRLKNGVAQLDPESLHAWSCRILETAQELRPDKADRLAALQAHVDRMREVERFAVTLAKTGQGTQDQATAAEYFRLEAELWLTKAKNK